MQVFFLFLFVLIHVNLCRILETLFKQHLEGETSRKKKKKGKEEKGPSKSGIILRLTGNQIITLMLILASMLWSHNTDCDPGCLALNTQ